MSQFEKAYAPHEVEARWYAYWEKEGLFKANEEKAKKNFSIVIPPPNVTGALHMGHALNVTLQDILCRYHKLKGENVLWLPGTDHAGIATQNVVERKLAEEGRDRHQLGREQFIEEIWKWRTTYGGAIINQMKRLGAMADWDRERFTMDEGLSKAVRTVFVALYKEGLIYRGNYITNWCCRCHTALSDLEVEHEETKGNLYYIRYPLTDGSGSVTVATTRPETMLADTAVAIHPEDSRYTNITAKTIVLPLANKEIPIIKDTYVSLEFGTGALKVTPAHDPNDFELGLKHNLDTPKVIGDDGKMLSGAGKFAGMDRFDARKAIVAALEAEGLLEKIEPLIHNVGHCYRCKSVVEPGLSKQWFVKAKPLAKLAIEAVETGKTKIIPAVWKKTYDDWMYNIRDWCISRQIWWGHRIPAFTCLDCSAEIVEMEDPTACPVCKSLRIEQEIDVLDTWFSSALWPFSTMGWPEKTKLLNTFYPTSVLVTGFDILFFWVARMMMMGLHFMKDVPFKDVYIHALVRDEAGQKMSKSKGNVIDPLEILEAYGTDAFRFTLAAFAAQGRDVKMSAKRVEGYRNFVNKIWNAARFSLMHLNKPYSGLPQSLSFENKWILSRLARTIEETIQALDSYRFNDAATALYQFVWHEFCDWYLEMSKATLYGEKGETEKETTAQVLSFVFNQLLIMLHPFMPFITEEIYSQLPGNTDSIMRAPFPEKKHWLAELRVDKSIESQMQLVIDLVSGVRNVRGEMNLSPFVKFSVHVQTNNTSLAQQILSASNLILPLARLEKLTAGIEPAPSGLSATVVIPNATAFVRLEGVVDIQSEIDRVEKELKKVKNEIDVLGKKLANKGFTDKAPVAVVDDIREKHARMTEKKEKLDENLTKIKNTGLA